MSAISTAPPAIDRRALLRLMITSREGDRREGILLRQSKGWFQVSGIGHEALASLAIPLLADDYVFPYYRDRAFMLARGLTNYDLAKTYFAKRTSKSGGRQMPGHYSSRELNVFSGCTPTGGTLLPACGTAWGMKMDGKKTICLATIGDAACRQGEFFEAIAFAVQESLPVVFVVEDNKYGISTPTKKFLPFHLDLFSENRILKVDGREPDQVLASLTAAVGQARSGGGPSILWCDLDRLSSHTSSDDHRVYRSADDIAAMELRDPLRLLSSSMIKSGETTEAEIAKMTEQIRAEIDADYIRADAEADPSADETLYHLWGKETSAQLPPIPSSGRMTMVSAINSTLRKALEDDPNVILFGEDVEDPKGGVFGLTKGLSKSFPKQVFNSPLAEATILGVAVGLAAYGKRPVFELQFIDFIAPGWNQVTTNMSTLRWRTFGEWKCPCVIYAPYGAYLPGGSLWHSQANESYLAHTPGIKVAIPSTPEDAAGLFWTAIHGDDPTFILAPKHVFRKQLDVAKVEPVPFGKARIVKSGTDVTLVTYGNTVELAMEASESCGADVEIIDLRSLVPCDYSTIVTSIEKTGRLVVLHEDNRTCGFGQALVAEIVSVPERFNLLLSPPQLVTREDVHIGYNPIFEYAALPDVEQVKQAIRTVME